MFSQKKFYNKDLVRMVDPLCDCKSLPFASVFAGILSATSSVCSKSYIRTFNFIITDSYRKMEKFLGDEEEIKTTSLDYSATIEALLESLSKAPHSRFQIWDEFSTLISSFGLYKAGGGAYDRTFFLTLHNGPNNLLHSTKKYSFDIDQPRLAIFASSHPETMCKPIVAEKQGADAFVCRFLLHVCKAKRRRLDKYVPFRERFSIDVLLSCIKVIHTKPLFYVFAKDAFTYASDICEEYDMIAKANEIYFPYIAYVYGKSKTHLIRIAGCLWVLEVAFKILSQIETISDKKELFISSVSEKFAELKDSLVISIEVVKMASKVMNYFIDHKLILSDLEKDPKENLKFINRGQNKTELPFNPTSTLKKSHQTLEQRILLTPGTMVYLTVLSKSKNATQDSFIQSCKLLEDKGLGKYGHILPNKKSTRKAHVFIKSEVPVSGSENEIIFINALFDFGCSVNEFSESLVQENIQPTSTPINTEKSNAKRLTKDTSLNDISNVSKIPKQDGLNIEENLKKSYLMPPVDSCINCKSVLDVNKTSNKIVSFCFDCPKIMYAKFGKCEKCDIEYSFRNYKLCSKNETFLYPAHIPLIFLATSQETCFEIKLLRFFDEQILRNGVTFEGFCDSYNNFYPDFVSGRPLNRIRLGEAWYSFKIKHYLLINIPKEAILDFKSDSTESLLEPYIEEFTIRLSQIHKSNCSVEHCDSTVILDGNHKNHRARCISSYEIDFNDENDRFCKESPMQGSYFCWKHNVQSNGVNGAATFDDDFIDIVNEEVLNGEQFYRFKYDSEPRLRLVPEKDIPVFLLTEFHKRKNLLDKSLVGQIEFCNVSKELPCFNKSKTKGILTVSHGCGIHLGFNELITSESRASVISLLKDIFEITKNEYKYCIYDDGCHLAESVQSQKNEHSNLKNLIFLIDLFHLKKHTRKICYTKYNLFLQSQLKSINSQACEQMYSLLLKYKYMMG
ncbi:hypothetical protein BpHYR1_028691 [Brachionus plicatilis]|uniref:Uncharacterized protein n=1 Tax=Brachionus plicatilis TaxID=10195 RepID=A0A3M7PSF9_BRAPC|nr:hypothetical protein BpHYR1_028691 [Brachionus plicatilis]